MKYIVTATMRNGERSIISRDFKGKKPAQAHADFTNKISPGANARVSKVTAKHKSMSVWSMGRKTWDAINKSKPSQRTGSTEEKKQ